MIIQFLVALLQYKRHLTYTHQEAAELLLALVQALFSQALERAVAAVALVELAQQAPLQAQQLQQPLEEQQFMFHLKLIPQFLTL